MKFVLKTVLGLTLPLLLAACGSSPSSPEASYNPLLPLPQTAAEPGDEKMHAAVRQFLGQENRPASSVYKFARIDLNGDRRQEALVLFKNPYGYWCDFYGCQMLILKAHEDSFSPVNVVKRVREPLHISEKQTNGWKDMIIHVSGRWTETKDVALQFDGSRYPFDPESLPAAPFSANPGRRVFHD